jgi:putative membrane protein
MIVEWLISIVAWVVITAVALVLLSSLNLGVKVQNFGAALIAAVSIGVLKWMIQLVAFSLSLWTGGLTSGLTSLLIGWVIAAAVIYLVAALRPGFEVKGFGRALIAAAVLAVLMTGIEGILSLVLPD